MTWRIYMIIDPATGEIRPYTPDLAYLVDELIRLAAAAQAAARAGPDPPDLAAQFFGQTEGRS